MPEPNSHEGVPPKEDGLSAVPGERPQQDALQERPDEGAASEAFQALANEVRVSVLLELLHAERDGTDPKTFAEIQDAVGSDSSAGFAYHLRQLSDHFVRKTPDCYVLTPAGRRAARAVLSGTFTNGEDRQAS